MQEAAALTSPRKISVSLERAGRQGARFIPTELLLCTRLPCLVGVFSVRCDFDLSWRIPSCGYFHSKVSWDSFRSLQASGDAFSLGNQI